MELPVEVKSHEGSEYDYFELIDCHGRRICDTLNCDAQFSSEDQKKFMDAIATALNKA